ncbi:MAG: glycosyltransferase family 4 protein [Planctomycetota bacterium]
MPLSVLYIHHCAGLGGAERSLLELASGLDPGAVRPRVLLGEDGPLVAELRARDIPTSVLPMPRPRHPGLSPFRWLAIGSEIRDAANRIAITIQSDPPDIIHANTLFGMVLSVASKAGRHINCPRIWTARDFIGQPRLIRYLASQSTAVIAISAAVREYLAVRGVPDSKLKTIVNGIDCERFRVSSDSGKRELKSKLGADPNKPLIVSGGASVPFKRHELFFETLARLALRRDLPVFDAAFFGDPSAPHLASLIADAQNKIESRGGRLILPGFISAIEDGLSASDIFISASEAEPFGRLLVEAMATGSAVAATDAGGHSEIIDDGVTGLLVKTAASGIEDAAARLLNDASLRQSLGQAASRAARAEFNILRVCREVSKLYQ